MIKKLTNSQKKKIEKLSEFFTKSVSLPMDDNGVAIFEVISESGYIQIYAIGKRGGLY